MVPIKIVDFAVADPYHAIQLGELWFGVVNPDTDYGPSIAIMTDVHIYIYNLHSRYAFFLRTPQAMDVDSHKVLQHSNHPLQVWKVYKS